MPRKTPKPWTVLIYMVADDPQGGELLDQRAVREMDAITKAALSVDTELLNVAIQIDFRTLPGVWRRVIGESTFVRPESNAAAPETLYGFFEWAATECPAEHYLLIFWGHTRGQFGMFGDSDPFEYTAQTLTLSELREALAAAKRALEKPVDIIAFKDCFMATLETAYELAGLADFLLASPDLVPVVGWPYDPMFEVLTSKEQLALARKDRPLSAAKGILEKLRVYYDSPKNRGQHAEVPYALLSTQGADAVVKQLEVLVGKGHDRGILPEEKFRSKLNDAAMKAGDPALADLGVLVAKREEPKKEFALSLAGNGGKKVESPLNAFVAALGKVTPDGAAAAEAATAADAAAKAAAEARAAADAVAAQAAAAKAVTAANAAAAAATRAGAAAPAAAALAAPGADPVATAEAAAAAATAAAAAAKAAAPAASPQQLVIDHTGGPNFGGVSVFVYPSTPKAQRDSRLTRLADEKVYKRLAISADTNWADIALQSMPIKSIGSRQPDISTAVGLLEQLQRLGVGRAPGSAAGASYLRRLPLLSRNRQLSGAGMAQAAEYATVVELAARLADFAAKAGDDFAKGGDDFAKGGDDFAKGGDDFAKGGDDFGPR